MFKWAKNLFLTNTSARQTVFKNTAWLAVGQITSRLLRAVIIIYAARILGAGSYGAFSYALSLIGLFAIFSDLGLTSLVTREVSRNEEQSRGYIRTSLALKLVLVSLSTVLILFVGPLITKIPEAKTLLPIAAFLLAFDSMRDFLFALIRARQKMELEAIITIVTNVVMVALAFVVLFLAPGSKALMATYMVSSAIGFCIALIIVSKNFYRYNSTVVKTTLKSILKDAWPFALLGLLSGVMVSMDTLMLGWLRTASDVGLYGAAQRPVLLLYALPALFATSLFPLFSKYANVDKARFRNILELGISSSFLLVLPLTVGGIIIAKDFMLLLYGTEFVGAASAFTILLCTLPIVFPAFIISDAIVAYNKQRTFFLWSAIGVVGDIALNLLLIPKYGIVGAAISTVGAQALVNIIIWYKLKRLNDFSILHRLPRVIVATLIMGVVTFIGTTFNLPVLATIGFSIIVFVFVLYVLKEPLLQYYKGIIFPDKPLNGSIGKPTTRSQKKVILVRANDVSPDVRVEKIAGSLHTMGYTVKVLAWNRIDTLPLKETRTFGEIQRIHIPANYDLGIKLFPKLVRFWVSVFLFLMKEEYDVIHACDFDTLLPSLLAAKIRGKKIVYDIFDFYAEGGNVPKILRPGIRMIDTACMHAVDKVLVVDEVRLPYLPASIQKKTEIIYNSPSDIYTTVKTLAGNFPRIPIKKDGVFRVVYSGNLIDNRYIIDMVHAVSKMNSVEYIIAGFGPEAYREKIVSAAEKANNVFYIGKNSSHEESLALEATADVLFALNSTAIANNRMMSANKLFEAMMLQLPVLVNKGTSMEEKVTRYNCGIIIDNVTEESIAGAIEELRKNPDQAKHLGKNGREAFLQHYQWNYMEEKLKTIYTALA